MVKKKIAAQHYFMVGRVFHKRHGTADAPQEHFLAYRHWCGWLTMQDKITQPILPLFFIFRRLFQFAAKDYGVSQDENGEKKQERDIYRAMQQLLRREINFNAKKISLISQGRVMFYVFNPVSFWLAFDEKDILRAIVAEVHNTYGEHHYYLLYKKNLTAITNGDVFTADKQFHVSPFYDRVGSYRFAFLMDEKNFSANIKLFSPGRRLQLDTGMAMKKMPMNNRNAGWLLLTMPLQPMKVIFTIHLHALYLFIKKISFRRKPKQLVTKITHGQVVA
ncbi:MAG: DUF1365 domain-containing protein [Hydrotalea sp.]|nr:DUF1365 domain-containing protein [Hydrotalea sp.]